jgi:SAM-dependent methyltransferase
VNRPSEPREGRAERTRAYYRTVGRFIDQELAHRGDGAYWLARAREQNRPSALELGAGTGRVTLFLAPACRLIVAVDLSLEMLSKAQAALAEWDHVHLVAGDMTELRLGARFGLVLAANDPFAHLSDDRDRRRAVELAARHLAPGGLLVMDALWLSGPARRAATSPDGWERHRRLPAVEGKPEAFVSERWHLGRDGTQGVIEYEYREGDQVVGRASFEPRFWSPDELRTRLSRAGLQVRRTLGSYREDPWDPETSSALIVEATRPST